MNHQEVAALIEVTHGLWPTVPFQARVDANMVRVWQLALADVSLIEAEAMLVVRSRRGDAFPPPPGELARAVIDTRHLADGTAAPDPDQAWTEISERVRRHGWYRGLPDDWSHPAVGAVVVALGWDELCHGDVMVQRAHFLRLYAPAVERTEHHRRIAETFTALGPGFAGVLPSLDRAIEAGP